MIKIKSKRLTSEVILDEDTNKVSSQFDFEFDGKSTFDTASFEIPEDFGTLLVVGPSGSGKSQVLKNFGEEEIPNWDRNKTIVSQFEDYDTAIDKLSATALSGARELVKPYQVLSNGQAYRADLARRIKSGAVIDEFCSVIDRDTAKSLSVSLMKYINKKKLKNIVFACPHYDIVSFLDPDYVLDTKDNTLYPRGSLRQEKFGRPDFSLQVLKVDREAWSLFKDHHYLSAKLPAPCHNWMYIWNGKPVGFAALLYFPHPSPKIAPMYKISRLVVLPEFWGMGFGSKILHHIAKTATGHFTFNEKQGKMLRNKCSIRTTLPKLVSYLHFHKDWEFKVGSDKITKKRDLDTEVKGSVDTQRLANPKYLNKYAGRPASTFSYVGKSLVFEHEKEKACQVLEQ